MEADDLRAIAQIAELPDGSIPRAAFVVVAYLDEDGESCFGWHNVEPDGWMLSEVVGLLELAKIDMARGWMEEMQDG